MKKFYPILILFCFSQQLFAQCDLNPTVTPSNPILCPGGTDTLWTEEFESYQWLKGNNVISGATNQFYVVTESDLLEEFKAVVTEQDCTDTSAAVMVDGWVFLLPYVIQSGDLGYYDPQVDANVLCHGDTMILTMGLPYQVNVQWYDSGNPIPGATNADYFVTQNGSFTACGSPDVCPNYTDCMLIPINVFFGGQQATVINQNDTLFSTEAESYQWYLNGDLISGATDAFYVPTLSGDYAVGTTDQYNCSSISEPFNFIATGIDHDASSINIEIYPNPASDFVKIILTGNHLPRQNFLIQNELAQTVLSGTMTNEINIDISSLSNGIYFMQLGQEEINFITKIIKE